jgi:5'-nucleotidase
MALLLFPLRDPPQIKMRGTNTSIATRSLLAGSGFFASGGGHPAAPKTTRSTPRAILDIVRILLTNDDGIDAIGLLTLRPVLAEFGEVTVVAPVSGMSGCSHSASEGSFRVFRLEERRLAVEGTPADCVRVALHLFPGEFDFVFAGINDGGNLGTDVYHSGTVAAVREAVLRGLPGMALSHYRNRALTERDWRRAAAWARETIRALSAQPREEAGFWNVNFPCPPEGDSELPEIVSCPVEMAPLPVDYLIDGNEFRYHGRYSMRGRSEGSDVALCFSGKIAASFLAPPERVLTREVKPLAATLPQPQS